VQHQYTHNAITALAFYQSRDRSAKTSLFVLAAEANFVKVFDVENGTLVATCWIFAEQTVHGITVRERGEVKPGPDFADVEDGGNGSEEGDEEDEEERAERKDAEDVEEEFKVAIWGGKSFALLSTKVMEKIVNGEVSSIVEYEMQAPDWILDGAICPFAGSSGTGKGACCVFVTAHSALLRVTASPREDFGSVRKVGKAERVKLKVLPSPSQSILYSAHVLWTAADRVLVAAGTVFGEIEILAWQGWGLAKSGNGDRYQDDIKKRKICTFTGHEGSIFGVRISEEMSDGKRGKKRHLASCSDDRTIRIWDLGTTIFAEQSSSGGGMEASASIRETGFGENGNVPKDGTAAGGCIAVVMAHASRIWRVDFMTCESVMDSKAASNVNVLSFGEDATCQQWALEWQESGEQLGVMKDAEKEVAVLKHLDTFAYHAGKHIWAAALWRDGDGNKDDKMRLVTGGSDGKVALYDIDFTLGSEVSRPETLNPGSAQEQSREDESSEQQELAIPGSRSWTLQEILAKIPSSENTLETGPKMLEAAPTYLETTEPNGAVVQEKKKKKKKTAKIILDTPNRYAFSAPNELLISTSSGRVLLASIGDTYRWEELKMPGDINNDLKSYCLILGIPEHEAAFMAGANGIIYMYRCGQAIEEITRVNGKPAALFNISKSGKDILRVLVTTLGSRNAHLISIGDSMHVLDSATIVLPPDFIVTGAGDVGGLLVLGARNGALAVYDLSTSNEALEVYHDQSKKNDDAVTSITSIPTNSQVAHKHHFVTTSRDGSYSIFSLSSEDPFSIALIHQAYPPLGPMIEAAWFNGTELILYGFRSKNFIVWNESKQYEVASVECGGAHRSYAYSPGHETRGAGYYAYTKASRIYLHAQSKPSHAVLKPGGHGREIKACATHEDFLATGAEDTTIRIWRHRMDERGDVEQALECCAVIQKHSTGIQHLQWCASPTGSLYLFSAGGNEEFYVWAISSIPGFGVGVVCEAVLMDQSEDHDLRIMGFDVQLLSSRENEYRITLIYSDSTIKAYHYSRTRGFRKIAQGLYTSACLTQIAYLENPSQAQTTLGFFTAATDGHLSLWEYPAHSATIESFSSGSKTQSRTLQIEHLTLLSRLQIHQSSISALAVSHLTLSVVTTPSLVSTSDHKASAVSGRRDINLTLVATAGDDNALALTLFHSATDVNRNPSSLKLVLVRRVLVPSAHAAGIMGLAFMAGAMRGGALGGEAEARERVRARLWTVGGDQRVKVWNVDICIKADRRADTAPKVEVEMSLRPVRIGDSSWCSVADPGGLVALPSPAVLKEELEDDLEDRPVDRCLVFGNGMEAFGMR
jgi:WD40 repeat protein